MIVLDTCALLWRTLDPSKLSAPAADACRQMEQQIGGLVASSISFWELGLKVKQRKLDLGLPVREFVRRLQTPGGVVEIVPVDELIWLENLELAWDHRDPADRTIVATARLRSLPIITPDKYIRSFYPDVIW